MQSEWSRLKVARVRHRWTLAHLASQSEIDASVLAAAESGHAVLLPGEQSHLTHVLNVPCAFLQGDPLPVHDPTTWSSVSLSDASLSHHAVAALMAIGSCLILPSLRRTYRLPPRVLPAFDLTNVEAHAAATRALWQLPPAAFVPMVIHLLELKGVSVFGVGPLEDFVVRGEWVTVADSSYPVLYVNFAMPRAALRLALLAEMGRLLGLSVEGASQWARVFLMPADGFLQKMPRSTLTTVHLIELKKLWDVPLETLLLRLQELELCQAWHLRLLREDIARQAWLGWQEPLSHRIEASKIGAIVRQKQASRGGMDAWAQKIGVSCRDLEVLIPPPAIKTLRPLSPSQRPVLRLLNPPE